MKRREEKERRKGKRKERETKGKLRTHKSFQKSVPMSDSIKIDNVIHHEVDLLILLYMLLKHFSHS